MLPTMRSMAAILGGAESLMRPASFRAFVWQHHKGPEMNSKNPLRIVLFSAALIGCTLAFSAQAKGTGSHQTHHCKQADGSMDMAKTKKACLADKGTWVKDAQPAAAAASAPAPAAASAPKK